MDLLVEDRGVVEVWTLDGEARRNSLTRGLVRALRENVARASAHPPLRCVVVTGAGDRAFCAGADLKERATMTDGDVEEFLRDVRGLLRGFEESPKVFLAALNGLAIGGGLELALACDLRVMSERAEVGLPEVTLGIIPGAGGTQRLAMAVGVARAKDLILAWRRLTAADALAWGLVTAVAPAEGLRGAALALADAVARNAPVSLRQAKRAIDGGFHLSLDEALDLEHRLYQDCLPTRDRREALRAFAEKRRPIFTGE